MIINMIGETERHLPRKHSLCQQAHGELVGNGGAFGQTLWSSSAVEWK